eukprot:12185153-Alexandrium_andersonii.AAC.1
MVTLLAQIGYGERAGEWHRPVVLRPLTSSDPGCRLRMASLAAEAAVQCFVLTGGAAEADAVSRAAGRLAGNRFSAKEVVGDAHDRTGQQIMVRQVGEANCNCAARSLLLAGKLTTVGGTEFPVVPDATWRAPRLLP